MSKGYLAIAFKSVPIALEYSFFVFLLLIRLIIALVKLSIENAYWGALQPSIPIHFCLIEDSVKCSREFLIKFDMDDHNLDS